GRHLGGDHRARHGRRVRVLRPHRGHAPGHDSRRRHPRSDPPRRAGADDADRHPGAATVKAPGPMLELERVETYRGPAQILRSISLTVGAGEAVCLVRRNGAGKTTTIDTIMGLLPARSGVVRFKGQEVTRVPAYERARMGSGYAPVACGLFAPSRPSAWPCSSPSPTCRTPAASPTASMPSIAERSSSPGVRAS